MARFALCMISLLAVLGVAMPAHAEPSFIVGESCNDMDVGTTHIASNNMDILACLLNTSGKKVWKAMTSEGGPSGSMCGLVVLQGGEFGVDGSLPVYPPDSTGLINATPTLIVNTPCGSTPIYYEVVPWHYGWGGTGTYQLACPNGYTLRIISSGATNFYTSIATGSDGAVFGGPVHYTQLPQTFLNNFNQNYKAWSTWTCVKN